MKTILVPIDADEGQEARLQAAFDLARACSGQVVAVQVTPYAAYAVGDAGLGAFPITSLIEAVEGERRRERTAVEARFAAEAVEWQWVARDGDLVDSLAMLARLADIVVMNSGPFSAAASAKIALTGDVAIGAPTPVLAVPPASRGLMVAGPALVAWDGSQEAALAMRAAMPLLRMAASVTVLTVEEKNPDLRARDAAAYMARHGINADVMERSADGDSIETVIRAVLTETGVTWMVQGAYGHSRLRQTIFGGVTRGLLGDAPVPMLIAH
ncbi:universal stress protein [Polymorphobacter fuscus]|uniref:Universal stress protein n=1 Tax=Sandarakinorhabdus fusca TaxID=1439888 RepID=A0A7C9GQE4_9SPHN|nr:universal stress protein [Polymorphobacter fuscus]KAB7646367.1 universal stress protein [Polymorphobacter fuscus]MQT17596.1 universal stress protein [Polymorphobacter fuscus]NJC09861.1 nucleotide-binding universal stress UspA family protein [Polymorphobacter fuscus]